MRRWFAMWRLDRRIERILREAGLPKSKKAMFTGNVTISERRYD